MFSKAIFSLLVLFSSFFITQSAETHNTIYVSHNGSSDTNTGFGPKFPRASVTEAVNDAQQGDTIRVDTGDFPVNSFSFGKQLVIMGSETGHTRLIHNDSPADTPWHNDIQDTQQASFTEKHTSWQITIFVVVAVFIFATVLARVSGYFKTKKR